MQQFISVVKFFFGVCMSLLIMAAGVHFTYMYYMTMGPVHDVFAVVGPLFIAFSFCTAFLMIYELTQELRSEVRVRAWVEEAMKTKTDNRQKCPECGTYQDEDCMTFDWDTVLCTDCWIRVDGEIEAERGEQQCVRVIKK